MRSLLGGKVVHLKYPFLGAALTRSAMDRVSQTAEIRSLVWTLESEIQAQAGPCCLRDPGGAFLASSWLPVRSPPQTLAYSGGPAQGTERLPRHRVFSSWGEMGHTGLSPPHSSMASPATTLFQNKDMLC